MNTQPTVFAPIMSFLPLQEFRKCVRRYQGDYRVRMFSCLRTMRSRLYHMGIRGRISRNNLANANEALRLYRDEDIGLELKNTVYAFDSTTMGPLRMRCGRKSGWPSRFMHSSPLSRRDCSWSFLSTIFYRF